jgi:thioesterase domain-containing protein
MDNSKRSQVIPSLGGSIENDEEWNVMLSAVGELWRNGITVNSDHFYAGRRRRRIPLPTYSFERKSYWLNPVQVNYQGTVRNMVQKEEVSTETDSDARTSEYTPAQRYLLQLWQETLGADEITLDDDFFDLGGHSLVGMTMLSKINDRFGSSFILSDIVRNPTIRQFSENIDAIRTDLNIGKPAGESKEKEWTPLVALSPNGTSPPIFCVAGQGGHAMELLMLSKKMQPDIPFYGLEARGVAGHKPFETVEEMAVEHLLAIREIQKTGPYFLCGYSFGGLVAYEMALRLTAQNETVAWLGLLDTQSPLLPKRTKIDFRRVQLKRVINNPLKYMEGMVQRRFRTPKLEGHYLELERASIKAEQNYRPAPYFGDAVLFRCPQGELMHGEDFGYVIDDYNGWGTLIWGDLKVVPVHGGHHTVIQDSDNVDFLAKKLRESLAIAFAEMKIS